MTDDNPRRQGYALYRKKNSKAVTAVQLNLDVEGFEYRKWGGTQRCKQGDWLVDNEGEIYTVDADTFARTYALISPGRYRKTAAVWARKAREPGSIGTREGASEFAAGDYLVFNDSELQDGYAVAAGRFEELYEPAD